MPGKHTKHSELREYVRLLWSSLQRIGDGILEILFPSRASEKIVRALTPAELATHFHIRTVHVYTTVLFSYHDPLIKEILWLLKYRGNRHAASLLGSCVGDYLLETLVDKEQFQSFIDPLLVPLPLSRRRERERGFNQTKLVAHALLAEHNHLATLELNALVKCRDTKPQTSLSQEERLHNLIDAFKADTKLVAGRNVILLDDIVTTGSSMKEARKTLLSAGAKQIMCIALAH